VSLKEETIAELRTILPPGSTVYTEIASSDTSNWPRETHVKLYVLKDKEPRSITRTAGCAAAFRMSKSDDAIVSFKSLRKAEFAVVAALSAALFPDGFQCIGKGCPSHEHPRGDSNYAPHLHKDGSNALRVFGLKYLNEKRRKPITAQWRLKTWPNEEGGIGVMDYPSTASVEAALARLAQEIGDDSIHPFRVDLLKIHGGQAPLYTVVVRSPKQTLLCDKVGMALGRSFSAGTRSFLLSVPEALKLVRQYAEPTR
jgi:hypothetical protein